MLIKSLRIKNYKSILDSKEIYLDEKMTIFIGKNESGKSNILKAFRDINDLKDDISLYPNHADNLKTEIKVKLILLQKEIDELNSLCGYNIFERNEYILNILAGNEIIVEVENELNELKKHIQNDFSVETPISFDLDFETFNESIINVDTPEQKQDLIDLYRKYYNKYAELKKKIKAFFVSNKPKVVYLSQIENTLPRTINNSNLNIESVKNLIGFIEKESGGEITKEKFITIIDENKPIQYKKRICGEISKVLTEFFKKNYKQYKLKFDLTPNGSNVDIFIQDYFVENGKDDEEGVCLYLDERSKGFNWFVSFVIICNSFLSNEIFVLDEPGMDLHLEGQYDMLNHLKDISKERQILFCTHSPYLIDTNSLPIVRLVEKIPTKINKTPFDETVVYQNLHSYSDADTIQTLLDAIGFNITRGLTYHSEKALIVEGISDLLLLKVFYKSINKEIDFDIFFAKSSSKMDIMYSLLAGLGIKKIVMLYDADNAGLKEYYDLEYMQEYSVFTHPLEEKYLNGSVKKIKNEKAIEDVFSKNDFLTYYLNNNQDFYNQAINNSVMAKNKNSKYLDSKILLDKIEDCEFDDETKNNIKYITDKIDEMFNKQ